MPLFIEATVHQVSTHVFMCQRYRLCLFLSHFYWIWKFTDRLLWMFVVFFLFVFCLFFLFFCFSIYYLNEKWVENLILSKNKSTKIVCHWLAAGLWFSLGTLVFSINKTDHHDIPEILLKVALTTVKLILTHKN